MSKIVQITGSESSAGSSLFALTDGGNVLQLHDQQSAVDQTSHKGVGVWTAFWRPLPDITVTLPVFVPMVEGRTERDVVPHQYIQRIERAAVAKAAAKAAVEKAQTAAVDVF